MIVSSGLCCPHRLARPRTPPFHGDNAGSNPAGDANLRRHAWRWPVVFVVLLAAGLLISCRERKPCHEISPVPDHLNDLESYRQRVVEDAVEEAENREGDGNRFKTESARRRVLAIPDEDLERDRQRELAAAMRSREELAR